MMSDEQLKEQLKALDGLSDEEKQVAIEILRQVSTTGESDILTSLKYGDFAEIPVDIDTFLDNDLYLGRGIWAVDENTGERRCTLFPYWRETLKKIFPTNLTTAYNTLILTGAIGLGKAQPLDALVLTADGFKKMGELTLQDQVYGNDGQLHRLVGIFPQGKKKICRVSFTDGTSTLCCDEHLWTVYNTKNKKWTTVETKQLMDGSRNLQHATGHRYKIPMTAPIEFSKKDLPIDPYILGVLIGDGSLTSGVSFASADQEIISEVEARLPANYFIAKQPDKYAYSIVTTEHRNTQGQFAATNEILNYIRTIGLNKRAEHKFIPEDYLYSNIDDRINLLQGLLDTDGSITKDGAHTEFCTVSSKLAEQVKVLVQSLGGTAKINTKQSSYKNNSGECILGQLAYLVGIKLPKTIVPFKLTRKANKLKETRLEPYRYITNIEYVGEEDCQCIYIDSRDHLYLTNDFIVTHNTLMGVLAELYLLYRMLCLKDPYGYYGLMPSDKITFSMLNITLDTARGVGWDKLQQLVQGSDWFMNHGSVNASRTAPTWQPNNHIELVFGSSNNHVIGRALFSNLSDEVNFSGGNSKNVENQKKKLKKMIAQIDARMKSRFGKGTFLPTLNIIISSKDTEQSFLDGYIDTKRKNESTTTLIIDEPQWVVRNDKGTPDDPGAFYVAIGGKYLPHELLPKDATEELVNTYKSKGYEKIMKIPPIFREDFETNIDQALMDIAGLSSANTTKFLSGKRLNEAKTHDYSNPFTKDIIEVGNSPEDYAQYANFFDLSRLDPTDIAKPLFIHLDMSVSGDKTGIAGTVIEGKKPSVPGQEESLSLRYKLLFSTSIQAPKGYQISFEKTQNFIKWLRDRGFAIKMISADTYQSAPVLQELQSAGFKTQVLSVDRTNSDKICEPYQYLKSAIYEQRVKIYDKCDLLSEELVNLEKEASGKINHPENGKYGSKDQADAFCGSLFMASKYAEEYAYNYGESWNAALEANETSDKSRKEQMIADFEAELRAFYKEQREERELIDQQRKEEYEYYQDISDGIIII